MNKVFTIVLIVLGLANATAQEDTLLINLASVKVSNERLHAYAIGSKSFVYDSLSKAEFKNRNLGDLLAAESSLYMKSYGLGSLATSSFRGGNANQTAVLWNGFTLNSSTSGVTDFSLIPSNFFNEITVQYGGGSAQWGSGAMGGSIHLNNNGVFGKGNVYELGASLGSFGLNTQTVKTEISQDKLSFSLSLFRSQAQNDFPFYKNFEGKDSLVLQTNANYLSTGLLSDLHYKIKNNKRIQFSVWQQNTDRKIPPIMLQSESVAAQQDHNTRLMSSYLWFKGANKIKLKGGYFKDYIGYQNDAAEISSRNTAHIFLAELNYERVISKNLMLSSGFLNRYTQAKTSNYEELVKENRASLFSFLKFKKGKRFYGVLSGRASMIDDDLISPTFSIQSTVKVNSMLEVKGKVSSIYRVPNLNDRYWAPGGNIDLLPETGFSQELGIVAKLKDKGALWLESEVTLFNKNINNWIIWVPNGAVWSPQNFKQVWSRGVESLSQLGLEMGGLKVMLSVMTNYVLSTNEEVLSADDNSLGKQLIYTPRYSGYGKLTVSKNQFSVSYRHNYTGYIFTSSDNTSYLSPFDLGSFHFAFNSKLKNYGFQGYLGIENVWGEEYVRIANRPLPLVNYSFGFNINLYQQKSTR